MAHLKAFEFFGGVPRMCIYDNLKTAVLKAVVKRQLNRSDLKD